MGKPSNQTSKLVYELDLELHVKYIGPESNPLLNRTDDYTIVRFTEESVRQKCSVCGRGDQAARRATLRNNATGENFYSGLDCLKDQFGVHLSELLSSTRDLRRLARGWQQFQVAMDSDSTEQTTSKAAVEDMRDHFKRVPTLEGVTAIITEMLTHISQVQQGVYADSIEAILDLLGILYEVSRNPELLQDRRAVLAHHPRLTASQRQLADKVLGHPSSLQWSEVLTLSQAVRSIRNKNLPVLTPEAPPYDYPDEAAYHKALKERAKGIANNITKSHPFSSSGTFRKATREAAEDLIKKKGGVKTLSFDSPRNNELDSLAPSPHTRAILQKHHGGIELADNKQHYTHVESRRPTSLRQAQRESQLENPESRHREPVVQEGFYRAAVVYVPQAHQSSHATWFKHGPIKDARTLLEDFTSSYS